MLRTIKSWLAPQAPSTPAPRARLDLEPLGERLVPTAVLSATYYPFSGALAVEGTDGDDVIDVRQEAGVLTVQGAMIGVSRTGPVLYYVGPADAFAVTRVDVRGLGGRDQIKFQTVLGASATGNASNRVIPARIDGGARDDTLVRFVSVVDSGLGTDPVWHRDVVHNGNSGDTILTRKAAWLFWR
jgi:hypothetical protein